MTKKQDGTRTHNPHVRSVVPYPLGHMLTLLRPSKPPSQRERFDRCTQSVF